MQIATYGLPKNLSRILARKRAVFACADSSRGRFYVAKWHGYMAKHTKSVYLIGGYTPREAGTQDFVRFADRERNTRGRRGPLSGQQTRRQ